jgi:tetratricopeptide (TPR) repeat protein
MSLSAPSRSDCLRGVALPAARRAWAPYRLLGTMVLLLLAGPVLAADSFYMGLLRRGSDAYNRRDYPEAVRLLRVACFGFLEEPELLADGLTRLALAQLEVGDEEAFRESFQRIQEIEARFGAYSKATMAPEQRQAFERTVLRLVPRATLQADPAFSRLVPKPEDVLANLPTKQRRAELEALFRKDPTEVRWPMMLAELEQRENRFAQAAKAADAALKVEPEKAEAVRLRGLALASDEHWVLALPDLQGLPANLKDPQVLEATLRCLVGLERWADAVAFAESLPASVAAVPSVGRLAGKAAEEQRKEQQRAARKATRPAPTPTSPPASAQAASPRVTPVPATSLAEAPPPPNPVRSSPTHPPARSPRALATAAPTRQEATLSPADAATLDQAQALVRGNELVKAYGLASQVAEANPQVAEAQRVAGEMAYRIARWPDTVRFFRRAGGVPDGQPQRQFYFAVGLLETGDKAAAAQELQRCVATLERTPFVDEVVSRILGP